MTSVGRSGEIPEFQSAEIIYPHGEIANFQSGKPIDGPPPPPTNFSQPEASSQVLINTTISIPDDYENNQNQSLLKSIKELFGPLTAFIKEHPWLTLAFVVGVVLILASFPILGGAIAGITSFSIIGVHLALTIPYSVMIYAFGVSLINVARGGALQKVHEKQIEIQERKMQDFLRNPVHGLRATITREQQGLDQIHEANLDRERKLEAEKKKLETQIATSQKIHADVRQKREGMERVIISENRPLLPPEAQIQAQTGLARKREEILDGIQTLGKMESLPLSALLLEKEIQIPDSISPSQKDHMEVRSKSQDRKSVV